MKAPDDRLSFFSLTAGGALLALRLSERFGGNAHLPKCHSLGCERCSPFDAIADALPERFLAGDTVVCIMAAGIVFRLLGPHLGEKGSDPAVIVLDEDGRFVVPLLGGHAAGANLLAAEIADFLGGEAVLTTSSDVQGLTAPDEVARLLGASFAGQSKLRRVTSLLVNGEAVCIEADTDPVIEGYRWVAPGESDGACRGRLLVSHEAGTVPDDIPTVRLVIRRVAAGVGCKRGVPSTKIIAAIEAACNKAGIDPLAVGVIASADIKRDEPGLREAAAELGARLEFYSAGELEDLGRPGSDFVREQAGTPAVCEPAALKAAGGEGQLLAGKAAWGPVTTALALAPGSLTLTGPCDSRGAGSVTVIGIGSGNSQDLTAEADLALRQVDTIIGYRTYVEQVRKLYPGKQFISGTMGAEIDRCREALALARSGKRVAMVSSGDAGVYGMAGPLLEQAAGEPVAVIPGVTSAQLAGARLGAPLMNDYITLSLSDLLTPRDEVLRRLETAAASDMVICLYNPSSKKRQPLFKQAFAIIASYRPADTVVGMVRKAGTVDEEVSIFDLSGLSAREVDMRSIIIIGNSKTRVIDGRMVTTRGYKSKKAGQSKRTS